MILSTVKKRTNLSIQKDILLSERPTRKMVIFTTFLLTFVEVAIGENECSFNKDRARVYVSDSHLLYIKADPEKKKKAVAKLAFSSG